MIFRHQRQTFSGNCTVTFGGGIIQSAQAFLKGYRIYYTGNDDHHVLHQDVEIAEVKFEENDNTVDVFV